MVARGSNGLALPFDTSVLSGPGVTFCGSLVASGEITLPMPHRGFAPHIEKVTITVPNDPSLLGVKFFQQVAQVQRIPSETDVFFSQGGEGRIGLQASSRGYV